MDHLLSNVSSADNFNILSLLREAYECAVEVLCDQEQVVWSLFKLLLFVVILVISFALILDFLLIFTICRVYQFLYVSVPSIGSSSSRWLKIILLYRLLNKPQVSLVHLLLHKWRRGYFDYVKDLVIELCTDSQLDTWLTQCVYFEHVGAKCDQISLQLGCLLLHQHLNIATTVLHFAQHRWSIGEAGLDGLGHSSGLLNCRVVKELALLALWVKNLSLLYDGLLGEWLIVYLSIALQVTFYLVQLGWSHCCGVLLGLSRELWLYGKAANGEFANNWLIN